MFEEVRDPADAALPPAAGLIAVAARAAAGEHARIDAAVAELFRAPEARLSDYQRITITRLLDTLLDAIEAPLRRHVAAALPAGSTLRAMLESPRLAIARPLLAAAGMLRDVELIAVLLRRAEEHRLAEAGPRTALPKGAADPIDMLAHDADAAIAGVAMDLAAAQARRRDRFRDPVILPDDLPAELGHRLVWRTAAAVRHWLTTTHDLAPAAADAAIVPAATALLAAFDEGAGIDARAAALARALTKAGRLDDAMLQSLAEAGAIAPFVAGAAARAQVDLGAAWAMALTPGGDRLALLLRAAGIARAAAGVILLRLADGARARIAMQLAAWDTLDPEAAREALRLWRLDAGYRAAILALAAGDA